MTIAHPNAYHGRATLSDCGTHRFLLSRRIPDATGTDVIGWIMFNPSTADAEKDDATIRKCIGFSQRAGGAELVVANLFSWRATDPRQVLANLSDASPRVNDEAIEYVLRNATIVVCAWGTLAAPGWAYERAAEVLRLAHRVDAMSKLRVIDVSKDGHPVHPLMQGYAKGLREWEPQRKKEGSER